MEFSCTARQTSKHLVLTLVGDVDMASHQQLEAAAARWTPESGDLVVNCSRVTFMDSMGLQALVRLRQSVIDKGRAFHVEAPSQPMARLLEVAGVEDLFGVVTVDRKPDSESAV